jgi:GNAT superfamily N-acetyltransferase
MSEPASIAMLDASHAASLAPRLTDFVNEVYAAAEGDLWVAGATRTTVVDTEVMIGRNEIALAQRGDQLTGCVRARMLSADLGGFGMLCAHAAERGTGLGASLVRFAESHCLAAGATTMQLELLVPVGWHHAGKDQLHEWYGRLGYRPVTSEPAEVALGSSATRLSTPCMLVTYHRPLA